MALYHASLHRFTPGQLILPRGNYRRNGRVARPLVFLHCRPQRHYTIRYDESRATVYLYEVRPLGRVRYGPEWGEYFTAQPVEVVRLVAVYHQDRKSDQPVRPADAEWNLRKVSNRLDNCALMPRSPAEQRMQ